MSDQAIQLDSHRRALVVKGKVIDLSQREFVLMSHLLQRRGQICTRQELLADVWGVDFDPGTNVVDVYVRRLRMKLSDHSIETVRNHGYRLIAS
jgi:two-component system OmpR family response regulator